MSHDFDTTLDECLTLLRAGADWKTCLARYPQYAPELKSLLNLASNVQKVTLPTPTLAAHKAGQRRMLDMLAQRSGRFTSSSSWDHEHNVSAQRLLRSFAKRRILERR
jgi:hypothetical protein